MTQIYLTNSDLNTMSPLNSYNNVSRSLIKIVLSTTLSYLNNNTPFPFRRASALNL